MAAVANNLLKNIMFSLIKDYMLTVQQPLVVVKCMPEAESVVSSVLVSSV